MATAKRAFIWPTLSGNITLPQLLKVNDWVVVVPIGLGIAWLLFWLETIG